MKNTQLSKDTRFVQEFQRFIVSQIAQYSVALERSIRFFKTLLETFNLAHETKNLFLINSEDTFISLFDKNCHSF